MAEERREGIVTTSDDTRSRTAEKKLATSDLPTPLRAGIILHKRLTKVTMT